MYIWGKLYLFVSFLYAANIRKYQSNVIMEYSVGSIKLRVNQLVLTQTLPHSIGGYKNLTLNFWVHLRYNINKLY